MEGHRIGVISDTHGLLRPETALVLKTCEIILHAGDVGKPEVLRQLRSIADTRAVRGNVDSVRLKDFMPLKPARRTCRKICRKNWKQSFGDFVFI